MINKIINGKTYSINRIDQGANIQASSRTNQISTRDIEKFGGLESNQTGELGTLSQLRKYILPMINVGTLGKVTKIDNTNHIVSVRPFPLLDTEPQKNIECECMMFRNIKKIENNEVEWEWRSLSEVIEVNDVVCVVFMDRNFKQNLKQSRSSYKLSNLNDEQKYHSESYGIVIGVMNKHASNI